MDEQYNKEAAANEGVPMGTAEATEAPTVNETEAAQGEVVEQPTAPAVMDAMPSILRGDDKLDIDDQLNLTYVLKNNKKLQISVKKPNLGISTQMSDTSVRMSEDSDGNQMVAVNNLGVYILIMRDLIKVILVDEKPLHTVNFDSLSEIGMTKNELDDVMGIIYTFYLEK